MSAMTGISPVIFFFLLSGFVLSRSLNKVSGLSFISVLSYYIRRFFRLYPLALFSLIVGLAVTIFLTVPTENSCFSEWFIHQINNAKTVKNINDYLNEILVRCQFLNSPLWTIQVELQCSFVLPLIIIIQQKKKIYGVLLFIFLVSYLWIDQGNHKSSFMFLFYLGHLININYSLLSSIPSKFVKILLPLFGGVFLIYCIALPKHIIINSFLVSLIFALLAPCRWNALRNFLCQSVPLFFGKISFSLYVLHMPVIFLVLATSLTLIPRNPQFPIIFFQSTTGFITIIITIAFSLFTECFIERPMNSSGHILSKML